ncbi:MAG: nuclear transport factor 2 family protein [Thiohalomonadales bacterium]
MLQSNFSELNKLLADDLIFTNHLGRVMNKLDDLEAHRSKILNINEITLNDMKI